MIGFAKQFDPQPFHLSDEAARNSHFGRLAASGWQTAAIWMRLLVKARHAAIESARAAGHELPRFGPSPGFKNLRWLRPVLAGDTIRFATTIVDKRLSSSRPGWGLSFSHNSGWNQKGEKVFAFDGSGFIGRMGSRGRLITTSAYPRPGPDGGSRSATIPAGTRKARRSSPST
ncbi:hypothetical protein JNW90_33130, partial [Micromonospora sp. STR1s_5]|nr:hypothetical protein [Micromonospora sp. STR1s_5]